MLINNKKQDLMSETIHFALKLTKEQENKINYIKTFFSPFTDRIFIVGGFLRDQIIGIECDDIDIEIYDLNEEVFTKLMDKIGAKPLSKEFFVYNFDGIDISLPRRELKTGEGYHGFKMKLENNPEVAILRRDFTCNSLMYSLNEEKLYDYCNGLIDIQNKILRVVDETKFAEDNFRLVRAVRLMASLGFAPDCKAKEILQSMKLCDITKTKIENELKKLFR